MQTFAQYMQTSSSFSGFKDPTTMQNLDSASSGNAHDGHSVKDATRDMEMFVRRCFDFARSNDVASLEIMLSYGLNPNIANHKGDTLLMLASYHNAIDAVRLLLRYGADVDKPNDRGHTPLAGVCFKGFIEVARALLDAGANPHGFEGQGGLLSPINTALLFRRKDISRLLATYSTKPRLRWWQRLLARF